ncbi:hypothetical protein [Pectobacterium sp. B1J-3]
MTALSDCGTGIAAAVAAAISRFAVEPGFIAARAVPPLASGIASG